MYSGTKTRVNVLQCFNGKVRFGIYIVCCDRKSMNDLLDDADFAFRKKCRIGKCLYIDWRNYAEVFI